MIELENVQYHRHSNSIASISVEHSQLRYFPIQLRVVLTEPRKSAALFSIPVTEKRPAAQFTQRSFCKFNVKLKWAYIDMDWLAKKGDEAAYDLTGPLLSCLPRKSSLQSSDLHISSSEIHNN